MTNTKTFNWAEFIQKLIDSNLASPFQLRAWIEPLDFVSLDSSSFVVSAPTDFSAQWVRDHYSDLIQNFLKTTYGLDVSIKVEVSATDRATSDSSALLTLPEQKPEISSQDSSAGFPKNQEYHAEFDTSLLDDVRSAIEQENMLASTIVGSRAIQVDADTHALSVKDLTTPAIRTLAQPLNPKYTFQTYVVGANNQFAHAAARAVAENPARQYNPLFIYSDAGLGKTHLMHAIGNQIVTINPRARVLYLSAEKFVNDLIEAIQRGTQSQFRQKYRDGYDILLMDDIQFIANKQASQEEFFHTFNALHASDRQIVVASDKFPKDIPGLEDRIRSRFEWGLVVEIQNPDIETRVAILRTKAEQADIYLPSDVALFLASNVKNNVRELEGALIRLGAKASLLGTEISLDLAKQELSNLIKTPTDLAVNVDEVLNAVAKHFAVKVAEIKGKDRSRRIAVPRQIAMYLLRKYCKKSYPDIGAILGGKDHSTILHGEKKILETLDTNVELRRHIDEIQTML